MNDNKEYTKEEILNINKTFHGKGSKFLNVPLVIFTTEDIIKVQEWAYNRYTNFNGGFGIAPGCEYMMKYLIDNKHNFTFISDKQLREDIASYGIKDDYEFNMMNCTEKLNWLEFIIVICQNEGIEFKYNRSIIDEILNIK